MPEPSPIDSVVRAQDAGEELVQENQGSHEGKVPLQGEPAMRLPADARASLPADYGVRR